MPELPDIEAYVRALERRVVDRTVCRVRIVSPFVLRSVEPPIECIEGRCVTRVRRLGKRIVLGIDGDDHVVIHLMIAGRLRWLDAGSRLPAKISIASISFPHGELAMTEASKNKRASIHLVRGEAALAAHDPGGAEPLTITLESFAAALRRENRMLKRALTDPRLLAGIGNAYSDEILHAAGLSPIQLTGKLTDEKIARLHAAMQRTLGHWTAELCRRFAERFPGPGQITAFRPGFAVHGKFGKPCPACGTRVQRIRYTENETNYCPRCQTNGKVLADRSLSRLLKDDWPRTVEEWE